MAVFFVIAGAWLGFWFVRKFVLTDDGKIDNGVSWFVVWSYRIVATVMILEVRFSFLSLLLFPIVVHFL